jgi:hypothetical protein
MLANLCGFYMLANLCRFYMLAKGNTCSKSPVHHSSRMTVKLNKPQENFKEKKYIQQNHILFFICQIKNLPTNSRQI